jgi:hypothetical protein
VAKPSEQPKSVPVKARFIEEMYDLDPEVTPAAVVAAWDQEDFGDSLSLSYVFHTLKRLRFVPESQRVSSPVLPSQNGATPHPAELPAPAGDAEELFLDQLEADIDSLIFRIMNSDLDQDVLVSLRRARRQLVRTS